jgi:hypothetical protein
MGMALQEIRAASLTIDGIMATGTGVTVEVAKMSDDITLEDVRTGRARLDHEEPVPDGEHEQSQTWMRRPLVLNGPRLLTRTCTPGRLTRLASVRSDRGLVQIEPIK